MTLYDAYLKAKDYSAKDSFTVLHACFDYGDVWGFCFMPPSYNPKDKGTWIGGGYETIVDKTTGEVWPYNPFVDAFYLGKGKPVPLTLLNDRIPPAAKTAKRQKTVAVPA